MLPHEIEVWYIIPAIRRELATALKENHGLSQKQVATVLNISPAAVSQYKTEKRAKVVRFEGALKTLINNSAEVLVKDPSKFNPEIVKLTQSFRKNEFICKIHQIVEPGVHPDCRECFLSDIK